MRWMYVALIAVLALVTLIFALQNLQSVTVSFLRLQFSAPLAVLIVIMRVCHRVLRGHRAGESGYRRGKALPQQATRK